MLSTLLFRLCGGGFRVAARRHTLNKCSLWLWAGESLVILLRLGTYIHMYIYIYIYIYIHAHTL